MTAKPKFTEWPKLEPDMDADLVERMYNAGFAGCKDGSADRLKLRRDIEDSGGYADAADALKQYRIEESHAGRLVTPFECVENLYAGAYPGPAQQRGDCVSHDTKNAVLLTMCCEIEGSVVDEVTGNIEEAPEVSAAGISNGVLSSDAIYWYRGYNSDGWTCQAAARVVVNESAAWLRRDYPELGIDLTEYSGKLAGKYGKRKPPKRITEFGRKRLIRTATEAETFGEVRDLLGNGYGVSSCGSEAWTGERNEDGICERRGSWAHAIAIIAADDRRETKEKYGEPLVCLLNSWGKRWGTGPRKIRGTGKEIPHGAFWSKWSDAKRRYYVAFSSLSGWPMRHLPLYGFGGV